jgi:hypothetical protein
MKSILAALLICLALLALAPVLAQSNDIAAERARIANQRSLAEAEQRAREEQERLEKAAAQARVQQEMTARSTRQAVAQENFESSQPGQAMPAAIAAAETEATNRGASAENTDISRSLEQLRTLGELKDAGYVTAEEFEQIKKRILDSGF